MWHANISSEYLPTITASTNKHVRENHATTNNTGAAANITSTENAPEFASAAMAEDTKSLVDA